MNNLSMSDQNRAPSPAESRTQTCGIVGVAAVIAGMVGYICTISIASSILWNCDADEIGLATAGFSLVFGCPSGILLGGVVTFILSRFIKKRTTASVLLMTVVSGIICGLLASAGIIAYYITYLKLMATNCLP
jgi:hypothetical protein